MHVNQLSTRKSGKRVRNVFASVATCALALIVGLPSTALAAALTVQMDTTSVAAVPSQYTSTEYLTVNLFDYGELVDGTWETATTNALNDGLPYGGFEQDANGNYISANVSSFTFWDTGYASSIMPWDDGSDPSGMLDENGNCKIAGNFRWGMFVDEFTDWSSVTNAPSRDLFSTDVTTYDLDGVETTYKRVYEDVSMEFWTSYDDSGNRTYHYSSTENPATFDESANTITLGEYDTDAVSAYDEYNSNGDKFNDEIGFWPFGDSTDVFFGLTMDEDFFLPSEEELENTDYYFLFSGDDDLVVYIDNQLVLDLGGAHTPIAGYIDFANKVVVYEDPTTSGRYYTEGQWYAFTSSVDDAIMYTAEDAAEDGLEWDDVLASYGVEWNCDTYGIVTFESLGLDLDYDSIHNLKLAYLERGGEASDLTIELRMDIPVEDYYDISLVKTADITDITDAVAGETTVTYTFEVTNTGKGTLTDIVLVDDLLGGEITLGTTTLKSGESTTGTATYTLTQEDIDNGEVPNTAEVTGYMPDGTPVTSTDTEIVTITQNPDIELIKTASSTDVAVLEGDTVDYTLVVTNTGNISLTNIVVEDELEGIVIDTTPLTDLVLAPGDTVTLTATYAITNDDIVAGTLYNHAYVTATGVSDTSITVYDDDDETINVSRAGGLADENQALAQTGRTIGGIACVAAGSSIALAAGLYLRKRDVL